MSNKDTKNIAPRLRFPEFLKSEKWIENTIGSISPNVTAGATPSTTEPKYWGGDVRWMNSGELNLKKVYEVQGRITQLGLNNSSTKILPEKCVLIGLAGQGKTRGTVAMNFVELCTNQSIAAIHPNESIFYSDFLYHNLDSRYDELRRISAGEGGRGGLNLQIIKNLKIHLPKDKKEQQKIADCLHSIDELIITESKKLDALKSYKKGLMQQIFPAEGETLPKLRFSIFHKAANWKIRSLGSLAENLDSKRIPVTEQDRIKGHIPYYGASGVIDYINNYIFNDDLLCISEDGANLIARTYPIAFAINGKTWVNNHAHVLKFKNSFTQFIVKEYLNNISLEDYLTGMAQPKLNRAKLDIIPIPLPTAEEQQLLAKCLISISDLMSEQNKKVDALRNHKKGLMQQLLPKMSELER